MKENTYSQIFYIITFIFYYFYCNVSKLSYRSMYKKIYAHTHIVIEIIERENEKKLNIQFLDEEFQIHFYII